MKVNVHVNSPNRLVAKWLGIGVDLKPHEIGSFKDLRVPLAWKNLYKGRIKNV